MSNRPLDDLLQQAITTTCPALQLTVRQRGAVIYQRSLGWLDPDQRQQPVTPTTRFDLASVSKLLVATTFMRLVEQGSVALDQPVRTVLPALNGPRPIRPYEAPLSPGGFVTVSDDPGPVEAGRVTFRHLLTHTSGLPAWRPLFRQPDAAAARQMALDTFFSYPTGTRVIYSDIGLILLGLAIETLRGQALTAAVNALVIEPLPLTHTGFLPTSEQPLLTAAPTEVCGWRGRRIGGEVHDENCWQLGGVSGHAGVFSNADDVARFGQCFLEGGDPILQSATVAEMTRLQAQDGDARRGLGFALWSPDPEASSNPFSPATFGHTGFTGTSLWIDPQRQLVVALLTNDVYHGRVGRGIAPLRVAVHRAVVDWVDGTAGAASNQVASK